MQFGRRAVYSNGVRSALLRSKRSLSLWGQEDAHEAISQLLDGTPPRACSRLGLMEETNVQKRQPAQSAQPAQPAQPAPPPTPSAWLNHCRALLSPLTPVFSFLLCATSTCGNCGHQIASTQLCTSLSLSLPIHNVMILSCILYAPFFIHPAFTVTTRPQQYSVQVRKGISVQAMQELLAQIDPLHLPPSFYAIQSSNTKCTHPPPLTARCATSDWVNGMLTEGKNLICRVLPPLPTNVIQLPAALSNEEEEEKVSSALHCFALHVLQVRVAVRGEA